MAIENVLKNAIDMHIHCAPDTGPRYGDSVEIATIAKKQACGRSWSRTI